MQRNILKVVTLETKMATSKRRDQMNIRQPSLVLKIFYILGDTVGDPLKDTSGPALNILIKLMAILSLVLADVFCDTAWLANDNWY